MKLGFRGRNRSGFYIKPGMAIDCLNEIQKNENPNAYEPDMSI